MLQVKVLEQFNRLIEKNQFFTNQTLLLRGEIMNYDVRFEKVVK